VPSKYYFAGPVDIDFCGAFGMPVSNPEETRQKDTRILIVDDDPELCDLVKRYLEPEGFAVSAMHSGAEGMRVGVDGDYDLIVLDVMLGDAKGFDLLRELRQRVRTPLLMFDGERR
jgi:DNA-binding response OmpR family regulator